MKIQDIYSRTKDGQRIDAAGQIVDLRITQESSGKDMAFFELDDNTDSISCVVFPSVFHKVRKQLSVGSSIKLEGKVSIGNDYSIIADSILPA